jgi:hypothetical protein
MITVSRTLRARVFSRDARRLRRPPAGFLDPVLAMADDGRWDPTTWTWSFT